MMQGTFWERFKYFRPDLDLYTRDFDLATCIPMAYHGDEGRGKLKRPVMVLAYQPVINYKGENFINSSGNPGCTVFCMMMLYHSKLYKLKPMPFQLLTRRSFTSRMLFTVVPSEFYAANTLDCLHQALVDDRLILYERGLQEF